MISFFSKIKQFFLQQENQDLFNNMGQQCSIHQESIEQNQQLKKNPKLQSLILSQEKIDYYKKIRVHQLQQEQKIKLVYYIIQQNFSQDWKTHIRNAQKFINDVAPGLRLIQLKYPIQKIYIPLIQFKIRQEKKCSTIGNIFTDSKVQIKLSQKWQEYRRKRTSVHQLLHALGFQHQHSRKDAKKSLKFKYDQGKLSPNEKINKLSQKQIHGLTRFDPYSIMLYQEDKNTIERFVEDLIWKLKPSKQLNQKLSQLDKVGLNLIFQPCKNQQQQYFPKKSQKNFLYYCGRQVMNQHNYPGENMTDGRCGPDSGPNCHACRVLVNQQLSLKLGKDRFQGISGLVYCGKQFKKTKKTHDGFCGPNNGPACDQCEKLLD